MYYMCTFRVWICSSKHTQHCYTFSLMHMYIVKHFTLQQPPNHKPT